MFKIDDHGNFFIGLVLEGFLYGLYTAIFAMYLQYQASKIDTDKRQNIVFYSICALYVLSVALFAADIIQTISCQGLSRPVVSELRIDFIEMILFGCCDFIAQFILIYRCWIVWGCNIRVVIIPSVLAFAFLVIWLAGGGSTYISSDNLVTPTWAYPMNLSCLALSLTTNVLVTGLIVFRILKVFREIGTTSNDQILGATGGRKLRRTIFILIESGIALFFIQLVRLVVTIINLDTDVANGAVYIVASIHNMLNGITPTTIAVRFSMGLSFHDEKSMEEFAVGSLSFVFNRPDSVMETRSNFIVGQDRRADDIGIQRSNSIDILAR